MTPGEVLTYSDGHRPVCLCGWVGPLHPLGHLDLARARLRDHHCTITEETS